MRRSGGGMGCGGWWVVGDDLDGVDGRSAAVDVSMSWWRSKSG